MQDLLLQVKLAKKGDEAAFAALCHYFDPLVRHYCQAAHLQILGEDAAAVARLAVVTAVRTFVAERGVAFSAYVANRVKYALWNFFKKERHRWQRTIYYDGLSEEENAAESSLLADSFDLEGAVLQDFISEKLRRAISGLPEQQQAILLWWAAGLSQTEIGRRIKVSPQAVSQMKKRALRHLKISLHGMV
jgi:RNA polymerase sigma factor (sigma-70 family)